MYANACVYICKDDIFLNVSTNHSMFSKKCKTIEIKKN